MIFDYRNEQTGEVRQVQASSADKLPEWVSFDPDGTAREAHANDPLAFRRIIGGVQAVRVSRRNDAVSHQNQALPVSYALPKTMEAGEVVNRWGHPVRKLKNGAYADMNGRRIVDSADAASRHAAETGFSRVHD